MKKAKHSKKTRLPASFRPILWGLKWNKLNIDDDKDDIIKAAINEGTISQWKWLKSQYGKGTIRRVLERRLASEIHPESLCLARIAFGVTNLPYARKCTDRYCKKVVSSSRAV